MNTEPRTSGIATIRVFQLISCSALALLFMPTFFKLFSYGWKQSDYSHGPLILLVFFWLIWKRRDLFSLPGNDGLNPGFLTLLLAGLFLYAFGAVNGVLLFEAGSLIPVLLGAAGFLRGRATAKELLFPAAFLVFLVPPPLFLIDLITSPLKRFVATASAVFLGALGYPVIRSGVLLYIGDYSLIIGDACSGLRSLVSLLAVGALYAWLRQIGVMNKMVLFLSIVPIAIAANIIRLVLLALVTFYLGDSSGQHFFHNYSAFFLFVFSVISLAVIDVLLERRKPREAHV